MGCALCAIPLRTLLPSVERCSHSWGVTSLNSSLYIFFLDDDGAGVCWPCLLSDASGVGSCRGETLPGSHGHSGQLIMIIHTRSTVVGIVSCRIWRKKLNSLELRVFNKIPVILILHFWCCLASRAVNLHSFFAGPNPDPAVFLNADPDSAAFLMRIRNQLNKICKNSLWRVFSS